MSNAVHPVIIIGGGPAGLSAAYELVRRGVDPLVLERTAAIGDVWRGHYEGLRLNTGRWFSSLPGCRFPWSAGRWPTAHAFADVLAAMPQQGRFGVRTETEVRFIEPAAQQGLWRIGLADGSHLLADAVVMATGVSRLPAMPQWPGQADFAGQLLHAARFGRAQDYAGQHVLVVGSGNSSCEIASRLVPHAASVTLSVRRSPHLLPKILGGLPFAALGAVLQLWLSVPLRDRFLAWLSRRWVGDLSPHGLPAPARGVSQLGTVTPTLYMPFVRDLKAGRIRVVGPIRSFSAHHVRVSASLAPGSPEAEVPAQTVVAGTGYLTGLAELIRLPEVADAAGKPSTGADDVTGRAPGLFFIGYVNPLSGQLREIGKQAPRLAQAVVNHLDARQHRRQALIMTPSRL